MLKAWIAGAIILLNSSIARCDELKIVVVGLFNGHAVIEVDQQQHLLKEGETTPEGVTLISANSRKAVLKVDGVEHDYLLADHIGSHYALPVEQPVVHLWPTKGMYMVTGNISGYSVDFIVDTGASAIVINKATAQRLGLDYYKSSVIGVRTASGIEMAYEVTLDWVQIGDIKLYNVAGIVMDGDEPERALLGMTFLGQLDIQHNGQRMELKKKF